MESPQKGQYRGVCEVVLDFDVNLNKLFKQTLVADDLRRHDVHGATVM